jgi:hypothetical protein
VAELNTLLMEYMDQLSVVWMGKRFYLFISLSLEFHEIHTLRFILYA